MIVSFIDSDGQDNIVHHNLKKITHVYSACMPTFEKMISFQFMHRYTYVRIYVDKHGKIHCIYVSQEKNFDFLKKEILIPENSYLPSVHISE